MPHLVVVAPGPVHVTAAGELHATHKFLTGMKAYAERFPGEVTLVARRRAEEDADNLGGTAARAESLGIHAEITEDVEGALRRARADVALVQLDPASEPLLGLARSTVAIAEHTGLSRLAMVLAEPLGALGRLRAEVGFRRLHRRLRDLAAAVDGVQCNGWTAWNAYSPIARSAVRVYDNRVMAAEVHTARSRREVRESAGDGVLRLGFSGRLIAIKGPAYAVGLAGALTRAGVATRLSVFGDGPLRPELEQAAGPEVTFHGSLRFPDPWCERVTDEVDVMVLPHVQPDPAGSYLEAAAMGAPLLGFGHETLAGLVTEAGLGWTAPLGDAHRLLEVAHALAADPARVAQASAAAFDFMAEHCFERDFDSRVEHLVVVHGRGAA